MDSGMLLAEYESFDALQPRLPEEVVGIMDQLLCHEVRDDCLHRPKDLLMTLGIDGMAHGKCSFADIIYFTLHRQAPVFQPFHPC